MRGHPLLRLLGLFGTLVLAACGADAPVSSEGPSSTSPSVPEATTVASEPEPETPESTTSTAPARRVLLFTKTAGFRHPAIPDAVAAIEVLARRDGFVAEASEDSGVFTDERLRGYAAVVFLLTTGDVLNENQQTAVERYITGGGGYIGVHSASDTEYDWPFYGRLVGAWFSDHPATQVAAIRVEDTTHPSTRHLPAQWVWSDEYYNFRTNPRESVHVLASLDESTYSGGTMGDHPIIWCHRVANGRAWYSGLGHDSPAYADAAFRDHLAGAIAWASGVEDGDCG